MIELLLNHHADPETYDKSHSTPLLDAAARGTSHAAIVDVLVKHGVDINK